MAEAKTQDEKKVTSIDPQANKGHTGITESEIATYVNA